MIIASFFTMFISSLPDLIHCSVFKRLKFLLFLSFFILLPFSSAFYFFNNYSWNDDFEDGAVNNSLWYNYTFTNNGAPGTSITRVNESAGAYEIFTYGDAGGTGTFFANSVARTRINFNDGIFHHISVNLSFYNSTSVNFFGIDISNGTTLECGGSPNGCAADNPDGFVLLNNTNTINNGTYNITINPTNRNISIYNQTKILYSIIARATDPWYVQFRTGFSGGGATAGTVFIKANNFSVSSLQINISYPASGGSSIYNHQNFTVNTTSSDASTLKNATLYMWYQSGGIFNRTTKTITNKYNQTNFSIYNISIGDYYWNVYVCQNNHDCAFATQNNTFRQGMNINSVNYNASAYDLSSETISINLTYDSTIYSNIAGTLYYNGTLYSATKTGTGNIVVFSKTFDIPIVTTTQNNDFYWQLVLSNSSGSQNFNSSNYNQSISPTNFSYCTSGTKAVNFTIYNEDTLGVINASVFNGIFTWTLREGSATTKNISVGKTNNYQFEFCIDPNKTFYTTSEIFVSASGFDDRTFVIVGEYSNDTTYQALYLLNTSSSSDVILVLKDYGLSPLSDYLIKIYRKFESTNQEILVESDRTDEFGQIVASLVENDVKYRLEFYDTDNNLVKTVETAVVACRAAVCIQQFIIEDDSDPFTPYDDIDNYDSTLTFDNDTNIFSYVWVDNTGVSSSHRLEVTRYLFNGTTVVCNATSTSSSGILTCAVGDQRASYNAKGYRTASPMMRIELLSVKVGSLYRSFGAEGIFWNMVLLMTLIVAGIYYPPVGVVLYLLGMVLLGMVDLVYISPALIIAQIVIGGFFIWLFRS